MTRWKMTCSEFKDIREIINSDNPNSNEIIKKLIKICQKYENMNWDFADCFAELKEDLEVIVDDDLEDEDIDYYLSEFYDLCDAAKIFLEL